MIRPNIAPRRITTNATAGLFSAARSSIRGTPTNTQSIIRSSPNLTRDQTFGINYVDFFGSKKNSKILQKSMKTIRDSIVSTFGIASTLAKTMKGKNGIFGLVAKILGGVTGLAGGLGLIATPIIKGILGLIAVGGLGSLLFAFRKDIGGFISDKASGVRDIITNLVSDFIGDRLGTTEDRIVKDESRNQIDSDTALFERQGASQIEAREKAIEKNITSLEERRRKLDEEVPPGSSGETNAVLRQKDALDRRIKFLKTGIQDVSLNPGIKFFGKNIPFFTEFSQNNLKFENALRNKLARSSLDSRAATPRDSQRIKGEDRINAIKEAIRIFSSGGDAGSFRGVFGKTSEGGERIDANDAQFSRDVMKFLDMGGDPEFGFEDKDAENKFLKELSSIKGLSNKKEAKTDKSVNLGNGSGNKVAMLPMNTGSNGGLTRDDRRVTSGSSPTHKILDPFDRDNMFNVINRNSLGIIG